VIDQLNKLRPGLLSRVINIYLSSTHELLAELDAAIQEKDPSAVYKHAHNLKNSSANLGLIDIVNLARELELAGRNGNISGTATQMQSLNIHYELAKTALTKIEQGGLNHA
jgi:two-component system, sensor histidine kinase and response regulator